jgi:predicted dehydrogenase
MKSSKRNSLARRTFLAGTTAATLAIVKPELVAGSAANSKIRVGLIGCGGRGNWIAGLFKQHGGYQWVAGADYFQDRADAFGNNFQVEPSRRYSGLNGYKKLLASEVDAVVIESPPYFHPQQAMDAVEAGKHVYLAKPIAVDVPGCATVGDAGRKATEKKLCFLADFQTRANPAYQETVRRVRQGDIGPIVSGEAVYYCDSTWGGGNESLTKDPKNPENRLRGWGLDRVLSGDVITEQNIHAVDVATWFVDANPVKAYGTCGKKGRQDHGTCNDHFAVIYTFPNDVTISFASKQYGAGYDDIGCRIFGPEGTADTHYFGIVRIVGRKSFKGEQMKNLYTEGAEKNIADFHAAVQKGDVSNATVAPSVRSNLTTILGRTAAYKKGEVTWDQMMQANEKLVFDTAGLKG